MKTLSAGIFTHAPLIIVIIICMIVPACQSGTRKDAQHDNLKLVQDEKGEVISVKADGISDAILVQNVPDNFRPFIHPIASPDGKGVITQNSPGHHKHQTGLYWGFTRVNDRDYFHHPGDGYWKKISATIIEPEGREVKWQTVYDMLDDKGAAVMTQTQTWTMTQDSGRYLITLEWIGQAKTDVQIGKYDYGGLFLRMPWKEGITGEVINSARQKNANAEGRKAMWVDVGMQVEGRDDLVHVAILDHPSNRNYPQQWRVDDQFGVGPALAREDGWKLAPGQSDIYKFQFVVYIGAADATGVTRQWEQFSGKNDMYSDIELWRVAQEEGLAAKFLTPQEAADAMTLKDGNVVNVWAAEPMMTQPMAFCWDDKGRLWVAENKDYESRGDGFSNAGDSRIVILEDTNHDGRADTKKIFIEGIAFPSALAVGFDGVFVGAPPNLLFIPDRDRDDKADKDIEVRLTGWGIRDRHETLNSFHWGPDGWLYGCQGFATPSKVRKPKGKGKIYRHKDPFPEDILQGEGTDINGGVWRYHPVKDRFEVVAHGFSNPWGIDYDSNGQLFISACVIPHMWHVVQGGIYHRQGGQHFNPYVYDDIKTITNHSHRSAHGGARVYQSDAFTGQDGRIFMANIHEHAVLSDILERKGSGFVASHGDDFLLANNAQWVGFSMEVGPDGGLYALDWHDGDICGQTVRNSETGRIFRIMPEKSAAVNFPGRYGDLSTLTDQQLVELQKSKSDWHSRRARIILQGRAAAGRIAPATKTQLLDLFQKSPGSDHRLRALWGLHAINATTPDFLLKALDDNDEYVRAWSVQFLVEDGQPAAAVINKLVNMARQDPSPAVRLYLASAIQRVDDPSAWQIAAQLAVHAEDNSDHNLPKMLWFGFERLVSKNTKRALELASESRISLLAVHVARRAVDADALAHLVDAIAAQPVNLTYLLEGMREGMEGRVDLKAPSQWRAAYTALVGRKDKSSGLAEDINGLFGDTESAQRSLAILDNAASPTEERLKALKALSAQQRKELVARIPRLLNEPGIRAEAIKAVASFDDASLGRELMKRYDGFSDTEKSEAINTLSSRPGYGWMLAQAIGKKTIPKKDIPANAVRQLRRVVGSGFVEIWGPIDDRPVSSEESAKYKELVTGKNARTPDIQKGQQLFAKTCGSCHKMFGNGGNLGPDLTGSNRSNIDYLLFNILSPSEEIQDDYRMIVITTRDGRTYSGNLVSENERQITLRVVGQNDVVLNKSAIQSRETTPTSMMPQGLLNPLSDEEVTNLLGYLMRAQR